MKLRDSVWQKLFIGAPAVMLALAACSAGSAQADPVYAAVDANVPYGAVASLPADPPAVRLAYGNDPLQFGELWLPATAEPVSLVVFVHGGCWLNAYDVQHTYALSTALTQAGYAVWSLEYRRTGDPGGGWPGTFEDILAGLAFVDNLAEYGVTTDQYVLAGHSAGGHLALLAGARVSAARAVIGLAAITDIETYAAGNNSCQTATPQFMGGMPAQKPAEYQAANPVRHSRHANTILLHGSADAIVPIEQAQLPQASRVIAEEAGHFDWVHPGTPAFGTLLSTLQQVFAE